MTFDKDTIYAVWQTDWLDGYIHGRYKEVAGIFENVNSYHVRSERYLVHSVQDKSVLDRYIKATQKYQAACQALRAVLSPVALPPTLPPLPEHHVPDVDAYRDNIDTKNVSCHCDHWHAMVCECEGKCSCHYVEKTP